MSAVQPHAGCGCGPGHHAHASEEATTTDLGPTIEKFTTAVQAKYGKGKSPEVALQSFMEDVRVIMADADADDSPTLKDKLDALKDDVGEEYLKGLLSNPRIESMAAQAWEEKNSDAYEDTLEKICKLLNGALTPDEMDDALTHIGLSQ